MDWQTLDGPVADHGYPCYPWSVLSRHDRNGHSVESSASLEPEMWKLNDGVNGEDGEEEPDVFVLPGNRIKIRFK